MRTESSLMYESQRQAVARFMRRLYQQRLTTTSGGNISVRVSDTQVALTASKHDKGELQAEHVGIMSLDGTNETPNFTPSIEASMHLAIYRMHAHVNAVVHAHPTTASAFCASDADINCRLIAESYAILGTPAKLPYACMGTKELAQIVAEGLGQACCVLMANHGVLTVGSSLLEAFDRLEIVEEAAQLTLISRQIGGLQPLQTTQLREIDQLMGRPAD
jgi:L-fuculose-phosphate aldolase